jgi:hypothetical protein
VCARQVTIRTVSRSSAGSVGIDLSSAVAAIDGDLAPEAGLSEIAAAGGGRRLRSRVIELRGAGARIAIGIRLGGRRNGRLRCRAERMGCCLVDGNRGSRGDPNHLGVSQHSGSA